MRCQITDNVAQFNNSIKKMRPEKLQFYGKQVLV